MADYLIASGVDRHLIGLTCKIPSATTANMEALQQGVAQAIATRAKCAPGADMFAFFGDDAPLYPETGGGAYVHLTRRGQYHHARRWDAALEAAGY